MRLALVVPGGLHPSGRIEVVPLWLSLVERLGRMHEVHAFVLHHLDRPQTYSLRGAHVHDLGAPGRGAAIGRWAQWRALTAALDREGRFDVVHGFWGDPAGLLAAALTRFRQLPSVVTFDSGELVSLPDIGYGLQRTWSGRTTVRLTTRWATRIHVASRATEAQARAHGLNPIRIPIGIDPARVPAVPPLLEGPPWRLLQVASLNRAKDQRTLIDAVALAARTVDVRLDMAGEDTLGGALEQHALAAGVANRVAFHGFVPPDRISELHARSHLYVQSSRHEGSGTAVLEAAAAGVPIVGTRVGYVADLAADGGATAVDVGDAHALADAIVSLIADRDRRRRQAAVAQHFALPHDIDWSVAALDDLYRSIARE